MQILTHPPAAVGAESSRWQQQLKSAITSVEKLREILNLPAPTPRTPSQSVKAEESFSLFAPLPLVKRMEVGNERDPLLLQLLPRPQEDVSPKHFSTDPLAEDQATLRPGLLKKYHGRALLVITGACAIHCRYCFRRHFPYHENSARTDRWAEALEQIRADPTIDEVILSGGDPLMIVDDQLEALVGELTAIEHLQRLRIHTRLPIMIPSRITDSLVRMLAGNRLQSVVVLHANHANEFDCEVDAAVGRLQSAGAMLLNQSVLLKDVNDSVETLVNLSKRLLSAGVLPYYLHQLDQVEGAAHFEVPIERGIELINQMRQQLPGFAVPRYVQELPGEPNKTVLA